MWCHRSTLVVRQQPHRTLAVHRRRTPATPLHTCVRAQIDPRLLMFRTVPRGQELTLFQATKVWWMPTARRLCLPAPFHQCRRQWQAPQLACRRLGRLCRTQVRLSCKRQMFWPIRRRAPRVLAFPRCHKQMQQCSPLGPLQWNLYGSQRPQMWQPSATLEALLSLPRRLCREALGPKVWHATMELCLHRKGALGCRQDKRCRLPRRLWRTYIAFARAYLRLKRRCRSCCDGRRTWQRSRKLSLQPSKAYQEQWHRWPLSKCVHREVAARNLHVRLTALTPRALSLRHCWQSGPRPLPLSQVLRLCRHTARHQAAKVLTSPHMKLVAQAITTAARVTW